MAVSSHGLWQEADAGEAVKELGSPVLLEGASCKLLSWGLSLLLHGHTESRLLGLEACSLLGHLPGICVKEAKVKVLLCRCLAQQLRQQLRYRHPVSVCLDSLPSSLLQPPINVPP